MHSKKNDETGDEEQPQDGFNRPLPVLPEAAWRRLVESLHVELGMVVVGKWSLPEPIAEVVASHHTPQTCSRVYRPLVQLVSVVDHILEVLDRGSDGGLPALVEVPGLDHDERFRIGALMPKVAEQMANRSPVSEYAPRQAPQGLDIHGRPAPVAATPQGDDHLDIPAFLRRQTN